MYYVIVKGDNTFNSSTAAVSTDLPPKLGGIVALRDVAQGNDAQPVSNKAPLHEEPQRP